ncbi:MAG: hypothetical protein NT069_26150 [Planctomycetota bacterium]|nr:hypothetical protein [Planctomycetota bacterium]
MDDALEFANQAFIANGLPNRIDPLVAAPRTAAVANVLVAGAVEMQILANEARDAVELAALVTKVKLNNASGRSDDLYAFGKGSITESELLARAGRVDDESLARIRALSPCGRLTTPGIISVLICTRACCPRKMSP